VALTKKDRNTPKGNALVENRSSRLTRVLDSCERVVLSRADVIRRGAVLFFPEVGGERSLAPLAGEVQLIKTRVAALAAILAALCPFAHASGVVVGGFNAARGGFESLAPGEDSALANDISSAYPGTTFNFTSTLTPTFLSGVQVAILGVATTDFSAVTPLSTSEQSALLNFVLGGGTALIFADNSTFASNAPTTNASFLSPFGVTITGTLNGGQTAPIINPTGPLTSPYAVSAFFGNYTGYFSNIGQGMVLANFGVGEPAIDYFAPGVLGPHSGAVVLFADSDAMVAGDGLTSTNLNLVLNAFNTYQLSVPEPSTWVMMLLGSGGAGLATYLKRRQRAAMTVG
jgi:PEP-CTERM motif